jgi:hypothetical protein
LSKSRVSGCCTSGSRCAADRNLWAERQRTPQTGSPWACAEPSANQWLADAACSAAVGVGEDEIQRSVVEDVPADRPSTVLIIKHQLSNLHGNFVLAASLVPGPVLTLPPWRRRKQPLPDRPAATPQVVGCDVGHRHRWAGRKSWIRAEGRMGDAPPGRSRQRSAAAQQAAKRLARLLSARASVGSARRRTEERARHAFRLVEERRRRRLPTRCTSAEQTAEQPAQPGRRSLHNLVDDALGVIPECPAACPRHR